MKLSLSAIVLTVCCAAAFAQGRPMSSPSVTVQTHAGVTTSLKDLVSHKRTMIVFLDPLMSQSREWIEQIKAIPDETVRSQVVVVLGVSAGLESAAEELMQAGADLQVARDINRAAMRELHITSMPYVLGVSTDGSVGWSSGAALPGGQTIAAIVQSWAGQRATGR
jgi:hypothetical protein